MAVIHFITTFTSCGIKNVNSLLSHASTVALLPHKSQMAARPGVAQLSLS